MKNVLTKKWVYKSIFAPGVIIDTGYDPDRVEMFSDNHWHWINPNGTMGRELTKHELDLLIKGKLK